MHPNFPFASNPNNTGSHFFTPWTNPGNLANSFNRGNFFFDPRVVGSFHSNSPISTGFHAMTSTPAESVQLARPNGARAERRKNKLEKLARQRKEEFNGKKRANRAASRALEAAKKATVQKGGGGHEEDGSGGNKGGVNMSKGAAVFVHRHTVGNQSATNGSSHAEKEKVEVQVNALRNRSAMAVDDPNRQKYGDAIKNIANATTSMASAVGDTAAATAVTAAVAAAATVTATSAVAAPTATRQVTAIEEATRRELESLEIAAYRNELRRRILKRQLEETDEEDEGVRRRESTIRARLTIGGDAIAMPRPLSLNTANTTPAPLSFPTVMAAEAYQSVFTSSDAGTEILGEERKGNLTSLRREAHQSRCAATAESPCVHVGSVLLPPKAGSPCDHIGSVPPPPNSELPYDHSDHYFRQASLFLRGEWVPTVDACCDAYGHNAQSGVTDFLSPREPLQDNWGRLVGKTFVAVLPHALIDVLLPCLLAAVRASPSDTRGTVVVPGRFDADWYLKYVGRPGAPFRMVEKNTAAQIPRGWFGIGKRLFTRPAKGSSRQRHRVESAPIKEPVMVLRVGYAPSEPEQTYSAVTPDVATADAHATENAADSLVRDCVERAVDSWRALRADLPTLGEWCTRDIDFSINKIHMGFLAVMARYAIRARSSTPARLKCWTVPDLLDACFCDVTGLTGEGPWREPVAHKTSETVKSLPFIELIEAAGYERPVLAAMVPSDWLGAVGDMLWFEVPIMHRVPCPKGMVYNTVWELK
uniref:Uncharacterized protein n=1 Tax=Mantoniella antarctica TaxID=81844 RepID=A0A7S0XEG7_9CHLO|mmetsp:Transcript_33772/g.85061  ORF Transcript_33772/g.85061 Transcript_33772/m.85061 type:complete len:761 (+) Transcript_33772:106-2388(+)